MQAAIGHTDRSRDKGPIKRDAVSRKRVDVGRVDDLVAITAKRIPTLIVGQQKDQIGTRRSDYLRWALKRHGQQRRNK